MSEEDKSVCSLPPPLAFADTVGAYIYFAGFRLRPTSCPWDLIVLNRNLLQLRARWSLTMNPKKPALFLLRQGQTLVKPKRKLPRQNPRAH